MVDGDFIEREHFAEFGGFGELPEDLRGMGPSGPQTAADGSFVTPLEGDAYQTLGGAQRPFVEPIPTGFANQLTFQAIKYLPRANFESFRSQRFIAGGTALLPPDPTVFVSLLVNVSSLPPNSPVKYSSGAILVPQGYAAVITGLRQWVGDSNAIQKPDGQPDDISWRVSAGATPIFNFGNFPIMLSSLDNEAKMFAIANESTTLQLSVKNNISPSSINARAIPIQAVLTGHWFPIDELDDVFRNR